MTIRRARLLHLLLGLFLQLRCGLFLGPGELFRLLQRLALRLGLEAGLFHPRLGALLLALLLASVAFAADRLQIGFEVVGAVVVVDLVARLDVLDGADEDLALARQAADQFARGFNCGKDEVKVIGTSGRAIELSTLP